MRFLLPVLPKTTLPSGSKKGGKKSSQQRSSKRRGKRTAHSSDAAEDEEETSPRRNLRRPDDWVIAGVPTQHKRARKSIGKPAGSDVEETELSRTKRRSGADQSKIGIARYSTESYKEEITPGKFEKKSFVKKGKTTEAEAAKNVEEVSDLVIEDFYNHFTNGLIIPHKAGLDYNG